MNGGVVISGTRHDDVDSRQHTDTFETGSADRWSTPHLGSPARTANVGVRRSHYGSMLSQSPARAGYATRMRQLFEEAGRIDRDSPRLYPQLPNISRKASTSPSKRIPIHQSTASTSYRPESLCLAPSLPEADPALSDVQASLLYPSERSSGSWSDDSGYIVTSARGQRCSFSVPPRERIYSWLREVSDSENCVAVCVAEDQNGAGSMPEICVDTEDPFVSRVDERQSIDPQRHRQQFKAYQSFAPRHVSDVCKRLGLDAQDDPYASPPSPAAYTPLPKKQISAANMSTRNEDIDLEEGGIQLSPLSPNVCLERGPSRHHSKHKLREASTIRTPCKDRTHEPFRPASLKENVVLRRDGIDLNGSPVTARKVVLGTRFRHLQ